MRLRRLPFKNMTAESWQNLALAGLVVFYGAQVLLDIVWQNFCGHLGIDYCAFWSAGHIARTQGFAAVYDLQTLQAVQRSIFPSALQSQAVFPTIPVPYLSIFIVPFTLLSHLGTSLGYAIWTAANLLALIFYLRFFARNTGGGPLGARLLLMCMLAFPVFLSVQKGQVDIWLTVVVGEYFRAAVGGKPFRAGLWLAGLLIKPQYLLLIGVVLVMQRSWRVLAGLGLMALALLVTSSALQGVEGFRSLMDLWLALAAGVPATGPHVMMNWRSVGLFLTTLASPDVVWPAIFLAVLVTAIAGVHPWIRSISGNSPLFPVALLGTLAATCAVAWHSHASSAAILLCPLVVLHQQHRLPRNAFAIWVLIPPAFQLIAIILAGLLQSGVLAGSTASLDFLTAISPMLFNLYFAAWAIDRVREGRAGERAAATT